jgi:hypothetical protein
MCADDNGLDGNLRDETEQTDRAAEESDRAGGYSRERYPEDPEPATPPIDSERAAESPKSD